MTEQNTTVRALHDLGIAAWFGGSLMGAIGLNGGAGYVVDPSDRAPVAAAGWSKWAPTNLVAIAAHLVGGAGMLLANRGRAAAQPGVRQNTIAKLALTGAALASTTYSGLLGARIGAAGPVPSTSGAVPSKDTPEPIADALRQQRILQWVTPLLTGAIIVLASQQGEQQRPGRRAAGAAEAFRRHTS